jgi:PPP family 3-phenylpropionic acid transporter
LTAILALSLLKYDEKEHQQTAEDEKFSLLKYWPFWVSLFFMQVSFGGYYNFFTIYESSQGVSLEVISYLWVFAIICEIAMFYYQAPLLKRNLLFIIKLSLLVTAFRWLMLYLFPDSLTIAFVTQSLHAFSFGLYHSAVILFLYKIYQNKKLAQQFMLGIAYGLGGFVGALIAGYLYGEYLYLSSFLLALVSFLFIIKTKDLD